jgi:taurine dioxygenase
MIAASIGISPVTTAIGAEIAGVDLSRPLDDETYALIRTTYNERGVVFFRDQQLDPEQFQAFGRRFGTLTKSKLYPHKVAGYDELQEILKEEGATRNNGGNWHTDQSFRAVPVMGTALVARRLPSSGGDTIFVSMAAAFDALSEGLKETLRGLRALHTNAHLDVPKQRRAELSAGKSAADVVPPDEAIHPVVGRHPESGREVLYVNPFYTLRFDGWTTAESAGLLRYLGQHATKPEFQCRFHWKIGSVAFWDNRQCLHLAVNDYPGGERSLHRFMVEGPFLQ